MNSIRSDAPLEELAPALDKSRGDEEERYISDREREYDKQSARAREIYIDREGEYDPNEKSDRELEIEERQAREEDENENA